MSVIKNTVPALIKPMGQSPQFVNVKKEITYHPANGGLVIMYAAKGWRRHLKKCPMKFMEAYHMPKERVFIYPGGLDQGILEPQKTMFVCGVRHDCHQDLIERIELMEQEVQEAVKKKSYYKEQVIKMQNGINNVVQQIAKLGGSEAEKIMNNLMETAKGMEPLRTDGEEDAKGKNK